MELAQNEFNDARSKVIRRQFDQVGLYNELFDRNRLKLGNIEIEFQLNGLLQKYLQSIKSTEEKITKIEKVSSDNITGAYSNLVNSLKAYVDAQRKVNPATSIDVSPYLQGIQQSATALSELLNVAFIQLELGKDYTNKLPEDYVLIDDKSLINLYLLLQQVQSGYNIHQTEPFKGYDSLNRSEKKKYDNILTSLKSSGGIDLKKIQEDPLRIVKSLGVATDIDQINDVIDLIEKLKQGEIAEQIRINQETEGDYRPFERQQLQEISDKYDLMIETVKRNYQNGDKLGKNLKLEFPRRIVSTNPSLPDIVNPQVGSGKARGRPRKASGISATVCPPCGSGKAHGGQAGFSLERTYELVNQYPNFPYYVPPNSPVVMSRNPRSRVHIPTEGSGVVGALVKGSVKAATHAVKTGVKQAKNAVKHAVTGVKQVVNKVKSGVDKVKSGVNKVKSGVSKLRSGPAEEEEVSGGKGVVGAVVKGSVKATKLAAKTAINDAKRQVKDTVKQVKDVTDKVKTGVNQAKDAYTVVKNVTNEAKHRKRRTQDFASKLKGNRPSINLPKLPDELSGFGKKKAKKPGKPKYKLI
jgi:X-X-X-Leu-X-X-Gly heptad repeat protein